MYKNMEPKTFKVGDKVKRATSWYDKERKKVAGYGDGLYLIDQLDEDGLYCWLTDEDGDNAYQEPLSNLLHVENK